MYKHDNIRICTIPHSSSSCIIILSLGYDPEIENVLYPCSSTSSTEDDSVNGNVNEVIFGRKFNFSGIQDIRCAVSILCLQ